jgi:putative ABC transport system permease protein
MADSRLPFSKGIFHHRKKSPNSYSVLISYLRTAFRNMRKHKVFSIINIICLSVGMSVGLFSLAAWRDIISVDDFHQNANRIYRVITNIENEAGKIPYASTSAPLAQHLKINSNAIEDVVQLDKQFSPAVVISPGNALAFTGYYATPNFLTVFDFPLIQGNREHALDYPFSVVITEKVASTLFRDMSPIGKVIQLEGVGDFQITGVFGPHERTHLSFDMIASFSTVSILEQNGTREKTLDNWGPLTSTYTYLVLGNETDAAQVQKLLNTSFPAFAGKPDRVTFSMQPLNKISLSELGNEIGLSWGEAGIVMFILLTLMCLLPACFNYTNVSIARALKRAKEIGVRKVSGGNSRQIFMQMLIETVLLSLMSACIAFVMFLFMRIEFIEMIEHSLEAFDLQITPTLVGLFILFGIATGLLAGFFPALHFSRLNPIQTLRSSFRSANVSKVAIRKGLIIAQFALSLIFILGVGIIVKQYRYALDFDAGYEPKNVVLIQRGDVTADVLSDEISKIPGVESIAMSSSAPGGWTASSVYVKHGAGMDSSEVFEMFVDHRYLDVMQMPMLAGSSFLPHGRDASDIVVNETFLTEFKMGKPAEALGMSVQVGNSIQLIIIGVVKDFHFAPIQDKVESFFFRNDPSKYKIANVRLAGGVTPQMVNNFDRVWHTISAQQLNLVILEDALDKNLKPFRSIIKLFAFLSFVAIVVSSLGLLAVLISVTESRLKELSIRKVVGASSFDLARLLLTGFVVLAGVAVAIAVPVAIFLFDTVLLSMIYYHAPIEASEIVLSVLFLLVIAASVLASQLTKVVRLNPVDTLKAE